jgi:exodeoxyribonuclease VII small subunit
MSQKDDIAGEQGLTYESAMAELQEIISCLEISEVGIDDLTEKITRAKELGTFCREKLRKTDEDVKKLLGAEGGGE